MITYVTYQGEEINVTNTETLHEYIKQEQFVLGSMLPKLNLLSTSLKPQIILQLSQL